MGVAGRKKGVFISAEKICDFCKRSFVVKGQKRISVARFCSTRCASLWQKVNRPRQSSRVDMICDGCKSVFKVWPHETEQKTTSDGRKRNPPRFCSRECKNKFFKENSVDIAVLREKAYDRDRGRCVDCGGRKYLETHHVDGNKRNNVLGNLVTVCKKCHVHRHVILNNGYNSNGTKSKTYDSHVG